MKNLGTFDFMKIFIENGTLMQLMDSLGNMNNEVSMVGKQIFDSNQEKSLPVNIEELNLTCSCSDEYQTVEIFN